MPDAGTLLTGTTQYVNAYTGDVTAFSDSNTMSPTMKTFYDTTLLENVREKTVFAQLGKPERLPKGHGKIVEWRKWNTLPDADQLTEGVIPTGKKFGQTSQNVTIVQHGLYVAITDQLEMHAVDPVIVGATEEIGASLTRTLDKLVRAALAQGTNVLYADAVNKNSNYAYVSTPSHRYDISFADATFCGLTPAMVAKAVTKLEKSNSPYKDGKNYVAVVHPSVAHDLRRHPEWIDVHKYAAVDEIFNGEIGNLNGVRFVRSTLAPIFRAANLTAAARSLKVKTAIESATKDVTVLEAISADEATALAGRKVLIGTTQYTIKTATSGTAGNAKITLTENISSASANDPIYPGEGGAAGGSVYQTMFFGKDAFAVVDPEGMGIETIIKDKEQIGGPLNQFSTIGGKFETAAKILYQERMVIVESASSYSSTDEAN